MLKLSKQRYRIAKELVKGSTNQEIADTCGTSLQNVKGLISAMMFDTDTSNRVKLVLKLLSEGFEIKQTKGK